MILFWVDRGVRIFRVDNPHTKALPLLGVVHRPRSASRHPDAIFLAEAFTRPKLMYALAKRGFTQSYTYFAWRAPQVGDRAVLERAHLRRRSVDFFRPNSWPNTPDILTEYLQYGGRPAFIQRLVLAATLCASYGIYGPAFELLEHAAAGTRQRGVPRLREVPGARLGPGPGPLAARPHRARSTASAASTRRCSRTATLQFHHVDNEELMAYSKTSDDGEDVVLVVVNLDPHGTRVGHRLTSTSAALGVEPDEQFQVHDLLSGARYLWHGAANYVELDPQGLPAHVFAIRRHQRTEHDFDYFQ